MVRGLGVLKRCVSPQDKKGNGGDIPPISPRTKSDSVMVKISPLSACGWLTRRRTQIQLNEEASHEKSN